MNPKYKPVRKKGAYNGNKTKRWDGKKWVPVNVVHRGQKATLNGKPVRADGKGNWVGQGSGSFRNPKAGKKVGTYKSGDRKRTPASKTPTKSSSSRSNNAAAINARLKKQKEARAAAAARSSGNNNSQILRPAPATKTAPPKKTPPKKTPPKKTPPKAATAANARSLKSGPTPPKKAPAAKKPAPKPKRKTSTTKGPTKSGGFYQSKGSSTKGGPTKSGSSYSIKSSRLRNALSNLKVRDYKKKK